MRRLTKKCLTFVLGVIFTGVYCEFLIYYIVVIAQCSWPVLKVPNEQVLKAFILADTHLLGPYRGHWLDKWRREWQMHQAFQAVMTVHDPDVVFVLGDLFDEGEWTTEKQFNEYVERFYRLFAVADNKRMFFVAGNHDIGFHSYISEDSAHRFAKQLNSSTSVQLVTLKDNHFVLINSMAMHGDSCQLCTAARRRIEKISEIFKCAENPEECSNSNLKKINYSRPIVMQHFPLYRRSDEICTEPDAPPWPEKKRPFRVKMDCLSKEATDYLVSKISPRAVFGGHTHHGCLLHHKYNNSKEIEFYEYSVPSFSWRNRVNPKYMLVSFTPDAYAVNKCGLPREITIAISAVVLLFVTTFYTLRMRTIGRR